MPTAFPQISVKTSVPQHVSQLFLCSSTCSVEKCYPMRSRGGLQMGFWLSAGASHGLPICIVLEPTEEGFLPADRAGVGSGGGLFSFAKCLRGTSGLNTRAWCSWRASEPHRSHRIAPDLLRGSCQDFRMTLSKGRRQNVLESV